MSGPKKWVDVYPHNTKEGDEEAKVFKSLGRNPKFEYRSIAAITKETKLSKERVEEIINKYVNKIKPPLIYPSSSNEDQFCYWERKPSVVKSDNKDIRKKDQDKRIDDHSSSVTFVGIDHQDMDDLDKLFTKEHKSVSLMSDSNLELWQKRIIKRVNDRKNKS